MMGYNLHDIAFLLALYAAGVAVVFVAAERLTRPRNRGH